MPAPIFAIVTVTIAAALGTLGVGLPLGGPPSADDLPGVGDAGLPDPDLPVDTPCTPYVNPADEADEPGPDVDVFVDCDLSEYVAEADLAVNGDADVYGGDDDGIGGDGSVDAEGAHAEWKTWVGLEGAVPDPLS